jgi:hypothetical protein
MSPGSSRTLYKKWEDVSKELNQRTAMSLLSPRAQVLVFEAIVTFSLCSSYFARLKDCPWSLDAATLRDTFGCPSLTSREFLKALSRLASQASNTVPWADVFNTLLAARNTRQSSVGQSHVRGTSQHAEWSPIDVHAAARTLNYPIAKSGQGKTLDVVATMEKQGTLAEQDALSQSPRQARMTASVKGKTFTTAGQKRAPTEIAVITPFPTIAVTQQPERASSEKALRITASVTDLTDHKVPAPVDAIGKLAPTTPTPVARSSSPPSIENARRAPPLSPRRVFPRSRYSSPVDTHSPCSEYGDDGISLEESKLEDGVSYDARSTASHYVEDTQAPLILSDSEDEDQDAGMVWGDFDDSQFDFTSSEASTKRDEEPYESDRGTPETKVAATHTEVDKVNIPQHTTHLRIPDEDNKMHGARQTIDLVANSTE